VLAASPSSTPITCPSGTPHSIKAAPGGSSAGLFYNAVSTHYTFGWQTEAGWAGTCRRFAINLNDGTDPHTADFQFFS
jgi:hypothetical protein